MEKYKITKFTNDDLEECIALFKKAFTKYPWFDKYENEDIVINIFKNFQNSNDFVGFVLKENENKNIVGLSIGYRKAYLGGFEYYIDQLCIDTDLQHKGVGTLFIHQIEEELKKTDMNAIYLYTYKGFPAQNFYEKNGFVVDEKVVWYLKKINK